MVRGGRGGGTINLKGPIWSHQIADYRCRATPADNVTDRPAADAVTRCRVSLFSLSLSLSLRSCCPAVRQLKVGPGACNCHSGNNLLTCSCSCSLAAFLLPRQQFCNLHSITSFVALFSLLSSLYCGISGHSSPLKRVTQLAVQGFCA